MIEVVKGGNAGLMLGLLDRINTGGAGRVQLYAGSRPSASASPSGTLVALLLFADLAGTIDSSTGDLLLAQGAESVVLVGTAPTWARVSSGNNEHLFDCDARLSTAPDTGQELVVEAPAGFYTGAIIRILSGAFSARP